MAGTTTVVFEAANESESSSATLLNSMIYDGATARIKDSDYSWDVAACCQSLLPTFHYLSNKLAFQGLHVAIIVVDCSPELLSAWPIDRHTQQFLRKLVARAEIKYSLDPLWVAALDQLCVTTDVQQAIHMYRENTYLVHRSLLQKDIIYSGNGLTVLAVDYVYKLKELLAMLTRSDTLPLFRDDYKESSITLLKHINDMYKDVALSKAYLRRAYPQFELTEEVIEEVFQAYHGKYRYSVRQRTSSLGNIAVNKSSHDEKLVFIVDHTQESPRKLPVLTRRQTTADISSLTSGRKLALRDQKINLGSPFEYKSSFRRPQHFAIARPRSPKGDLFESARSASTTSPKSMDNFSEAPPSSSRSSSFPSSGDDCELARVETASTISSRKRRFFAPFLNLSRSNSLSSFLKQKTSIRHTSFSRGSHNTNANSNDFALPHSSKPRRLSEDKRPTRYL